MPRVRILVDGVDVPTLGTLDRGWTGELPRLTALALVAAGSAEALRPERPFLDGPTGGAAAPTGPRRRVDAMMRPGAACSRTDPDDVG